MKKNTVLCLFCLFPVFFTLCCGVKTPLKLPRKKTLQVIRLQAKLIEKKVKLSWTSQGQVDKFKILRCQAKAGKVCPRCPLTLKDVATVRDKVWFDEDIRPDYIYWYQVCPLSQGKTGRCSEVIEIRVTRIPQ